VRRRPRPEAVRRHPLRPRSSRNPKCQAVDPGGEEPLDQAITCLARTIYWEAKAEGMPAWKPSLMSL